MSQVLTLLVEGEGDALAVPGLVLRLLREAGHEAWTVKKPKIVGGVGTLRKRMDDLAAYLRTEQPDGVLVLLDLDDGCPKQEAAKLAAEWRAHALPFPIAVVLAHREFEAWLLASLPTIARNVAELPNELTYDAEPEARRGVKKWLISQMPPGRGYKERLHQKAYAKHLDPTLAAKRSRSFRRLTTALAQLVQHAGTGTVTP